MMVAGQLHAVLRFKMHTIVHLDCDYKYFAYKIRISN